MRRDEHELLRLYAEQARDLVDLGRRLVDARQLRRQHAVEAEIAVAMRGRRAWPRARSRASP